MPLSPACSSTRDKDGEPRLLALLQAYVANQGDGWTYALEYLRRHLEQHRTAPATDALPANAHEAFLTLVRVLAVRTAELHRALATRSTEAAFDPQPVTRADIDAYRDRANEEAQNALEALKSHLTELARADRDRAAAVLAQRDRIVERIEACAARRAAGYEDPHPRRLPPRAGAAHTKRLRHRRFRGRAGHGLEQRRAKQSPLRDVAGMLRSFSYVEHSALRVVAHDEVEYAKLAPLARAWTQEVRSAFLAAYDASARGASLYGALSPGSGLLGLFELEKALYELRYELGNRPAWAGIPLQGILEWGAT